MTDPELIVRWLRGLAAGEPNSVARNTLRSAADDIEQGVYRLDDGIDWVTFDALAVLPLRAPHPTDERA